jgi:hypothetical protein
MTPHSLATGSHSAGPGARRVEDPTLALIAEGQELWKQDQPHAGKEKFLAALDGLVRQYQSEIIGFCVELLQGTGVQGEDIAQEVFVGCGIGAVWQNIMSPSYTGRTEPRSSRQSSSCKTKSFLRGCKPA